MNETIVYLLKVNIAIALFYMFYRLFFANDTFWNTRRIYLLFSIVASFSYPFLSIESWLQNQEPIRALVTNYVQLQEFTVTAKADSGYFSITNMLWIVYGVVFIALIIKLLIQLLSILKIRINGKTQLIEHVKIIAIDKEITPFSFFNKIYINPNLHNEEETRQILTHELTHVRQLHSFDVIISELLCIFFWINPASWLLKREIRQNLEFLADNKVINSGFDSKNYQYHLLQLSYQSPNLKLTNKFNVLPLKKRILMMNQQKSRKSTAFKYLLIAPLTFALVVISNAETLANSAKEILNQEKKTIQHVQVKTKSEPKQIAELTVVGYPPVNNTKNAETPPPTPDKDDVIFMVVENMPKYPGGDQELFKFLSNNVKYPVKAIEGNIQGRVICQFVVNTDGSVQDAEVVRSVDPSLDAEAIRIIKAMPKWIPGTQKGKAVRVKYTLPINFKLDDKKKEDNKNEKLNFTDLTNVDVSKQPLIMLDDNILTLEEAAKINASDIKSINILKDQAATSLFGDKGKNGVILMKTK